MTHARPTLRTRLLGSLVLVAVVVLAIAGGVTYLFVQGTAERAAVSDLRSKAPTVQTDVTRLAARCAGPPSPRATAGQLRSGSRRPVRPCVRSAAPSASPRPASSSSTRAAP